MIKKCSGCDTIFTEKERRRPKDMVYKFMMFRSRLKGDSTWIKNTYRFLAYFHCVDLGCLRNLKELRHLEKMISTWEMKLTLHYQRNAWMNLNKGKYGTT